MENENVGKLLRFLKDCCENGMCEMCPMYFEKDYRKCRFRERELMVKPDHVLVESED